MRQFQVEKEMDHKQLPVFLFFAANLLVSGAAGTARADEITDQIETARKAYDAGELKRAAQELQFAVAAIEQRIGDRYLKLLPAPLEGWTADEAQSQGGGFAGMFVGTSVTRRYYKTGGSEQIEISLLADSPLMPAMAMMLSNPMLIQADPESKPYRHKGYSGLLKHDPAADRWELTLLMGGRILLQAAGQGLRDRTSLDAYLDAMDLAEVEKAFSG